MSFEIQDILKRIDSTFLKPNASRKDIERLCMDARRYGFAAVCVNPYFVRFASELLKGTEVRVCGVIGFPLGATLKEVKVAEARLVKKFGASEIDMMVNLSAFKSGKYDEVKEEIAEVRKIIGEGVLKVIIECCYLNDEEKILLASLAEEAGADYIKTSTGFGPAGAKIEDVKLLRRVLKPETGIKAAGGIRSAEQVREFLRAGADRIGTSSAVKIAEELLGSSEV
ncbi:MAG: deoxyribose-phosphate aldolase [Thaumarchaeota archaeon]|nr:deoxyribose-phosphate aldolase [Nitrososphaerota archaeon]